MPHINLLPWREERRKELKNQFIAILASVFIAAVVIAGLIYFYYVQLFHFQHRRIAYINEKIVLLDKQLEEVKTLEEEKQHLLSRIRTIERLQYNRPLSVRLFDEIVNSLPDGVSLTTLKQDEGTIEIVGLAQSNARVSSFMRKISSSKWITQPKLHLIKVDEKNQEQTKSSMHYFQLKFTQVIPKSDGEEE